MFLVFYIFVFIFGLSVGSFLNCVVYRLALPNFSFWKNLGGLSRSYCPHCRHALSWQDLIPVFSFVLLKGKCRYCKKQISWQYPAIEILTGLIFVLIFNHNFNFLNLAFLFYAACVLLIIFVYDLKHYIIPDKVLFPAIIIAFLYRLFENSAPFSNFILAALIASGFFLTIFLISGGRWMGFGDVKLALFMGLFLGYPNILVALFLAFFLGAIIGVGLIIFGNKKLKSEIPFAPFLITGTFIALLYGQKLIEWYLNI